MVEQVPQELRLDVEFADRAQRRESRLVADRMDVDHLQARAEFAGDRAFLDKILNEGDGHGDIEGGKGEGGPGVLPKAVKFQMRPNPLAK